MLSRHHASRHRPVTRLSARGFTLIELLVTVALIAVGVSLAGPSFSRMLANYSVRSGAEGILNGLHLARAEAVKRNAPVTFELGAQGGWNISDDGNVLQSRSGADSRGLSATSSTSSVEVTFLATGLVDATGTRLSQVTVASPTPGTEARRIDILGGGLIRMCDPTALSASDPRRC